MTSSFRILPPPPRPPLTVAEALRNIANEALERRRARGPLAEYYPDCPSAESILNPFDEAEQHRSQVDA